MNSENMKPTEETSLSRTIRTSEDKAAYDAACKRILAHKRILAWILRECAEEYRDCSLEDIENKYIEPTPQIGSVPVLPDDVADEEALAEEPDQLPIIHGIGMEDGSRFEQSITFDVRFRALAPKGDGCITLLVNAEGQKNYTPGYPLSKRDIYYCSRMISSQYGTEFDHSHYEKIKKVYSIWICMDPPQRRQNTITLYRFQEVNLVGNVKEPRDNYDLMNLVMVCLGSAENSQNQTLQMLDILFSTMDQEKKRERLEKEFGLPMTQELDKEVTVMCNFSDVIEQKGIEKGLAQGRQEGRREGELNLLQRLKETANRMKSKGFDLDLICECTGLDREVVEAL